MSPSNGQSGRTHTTDPSWIDYQADCGESCETVDKTKLKFFKIDGVGLVDGSEVPGTWGDDQLIKNNNSWMVEIPKSIAPGNYDLRHELMVLHGAQTEGGAQDYPQCFNLKVTGGGSDKPEGTLGTELYKPKGDGIVVNIYSSLSSYQVPGPTMYSGATSITQTTFDVTSTDSATAGSGSAPASGSASASTSAAVKKNAAVATMSTVSVRVPGAGSSSNTPIASSTPAASATPSTPIPMSSPVSSSSLAASSSAPSPSMAGGVQSAYGQCGGVTWNGPKACADGSQCSSMNPYYHQCAPTTA